MATKLDIFKEKSKHFQVKFVATKLDFFKRCDISSDEFVPSNKIFMLRGEDIFNLGLWQLFVLIVTSS